MTKRTHGAVFLILAGALINALLFAQAGRSSRGPGALERGRGGGKSLRPPDNKQIRTAVSRLMGWRVGIASTVFPQLTFSEAAGVADSLGLATIEGYSTQKVSPALPKNLDYKLSVDELGFVKSRLAELNLKMSVYRVDSVGADEEASRKIFEFAKSLGVETIVSGSEPVSLPALDSLANEFGLNLAVEIGSPTNNLMSRLGGASRRIGVSADIGAWIEAGIRPMDGLALLNGRLMVVHLRDRSAFGPRALDVTLGNGVAAVTQLLMELAREEPPPQEARAKCTNCPQIYGGVKPLFIALDAKTYDAGAENTFAELWRSAEAFEQAVRPAMGYRVEQDSRLIPITSPDEVPAEEKQKIEAALPRKAIVKPKKPRKLLVIDLCPAGEFHHYTIAHTNLAVKLMSQYTAAYQPLFSNDLNNLKYPAITQFDAVFLNTTVGEVFADPQVLNGLMRFVREGGGLAVMHAASYASLDLPQFGEMIGAADGPHRVETDTLKIDDLSSPLTQGFANSQLTKESGGLEFVYTDEFFHFLPTGPYSRDKLHVLISIDTQKSDMSRWNVRPDNDYGLSWIKSYGKGRIFYCAMGHTPTFFATSPLAELVLGGIQFVLGDLDADTTPSAKQVAIKKER